MARPEWLKTLVLMSLVVILFGLLLSGTLTRGWLFSSMLVSQPLCLIVAVGVAHDASHGALSKDSRLNRWGVRVFDALGVNSYVWQFEHVIAHHGAPNVSGHDVNLTGWGLRLDPRRPLHWHHSYQHFYAPFIYSLASLFKVFVGDFTTFWRIRSSVSTEGKGWPSEVARLWCWKAIALTWTVILPVLVNSDFSVVFGGYLLGHVVTGLMMGAMFQPTHTNEFVRWPTPHLNGRIAHSYEENTLITTADFCVASRWVTWLCGGLNIHAVHHIFPMVPHRELRSAARRVSEVAPRHGLRYVTFKTWPAAICSHFRALAVLGRTAPEDVPPDGDIFGRVAGDEHTRARHQASLEAGAAL